MVSDKIGDAAGDAAGYVMIDVVGVRRQLAIHAVRDTVSGTVHETMGDIVGMSGRKAHQEARNMTREK